MTSGLANKTPASGLHCQCKPTYCHTLDITHPAMQHTWSALVDLVACVKCIQVCLCPEAANVEVKEESASNKASMKPPAEKKSKLR